MEPKKQQTSIAPILYGLLALAVLLVALHTAVAHEIAEGMKAAGELDGSAYFMTVLDLTAARLGEQPLSIVINEYTAKFVLYAELGCFLVILAINGQKKNYIHGKEFGTARWGGLSDIKDLFASSIEREEIRRARQVKHPLGRWRVKRQIYEEIGRQERFERRERLRALREAEDQARLEGKGNRALYQKAVSQAMRELRQETAESKRLAWKPNEYKGELTGRLSELESDPLYSPAERKAAAAAARKEYRAQLASFYSGKGKIERIKAKYQDADMLFTRTERISFYNFKLNQNTVILGGAGSGKTRGFVMPNILQAHSSYIVTDPKGEILEKSGYFLEKVKGYQIRVLNLDQKSQSDGYNPFVYVHPEREGYEERVLSLIEAIIVNTDGGEKKGSSDPFWDKAERLFLQAIFFFTVKFKPGDRTMSTVLDLIGLLELSEEEDAMDSPLDKWVACMKTPKGEKTRFWRDTFFDENGNELEGLTEDEIWRRNNEAWGVGYGLFPEDYIGVQQYDEFRQKASGKTAKSIVISAVARLAPFRTPGVKKIFSYDNMHLERVGEEKTAVFVVVPPTDATFNFIAGMLFTQLFQELQYCAAQVHKHEGQRLPVPCRFILDEFANTCTIPNFVKILAYARSFGIGIVPILQSLEQIKNMYKDEWGVILDNCNTLLYLGGIAHMDTLEYISKLLGKGTFDKRSTGRSRGRSGSSSENFDVVGRELLDPSEVSKIDKKNCLFFVSGRHPFFSEKYDYTNHPNYRFTSDGDHSLTYHYVPAPPPEEVEPEQSPHGEQAPGEQDLWIAQGQARAAEGGVRLEDPGEGMVGRLVAGLTEGSLEPSGLIPEDGEPVPEDPEEYMPWLEGRRAAVAEDEITPRERVQQGLKDPGDGGVHFLSEQEQGRLLACQGRRLVAREGVLDGLQPVSIETEDGEADDPAMNMAQELPHGEEAWPEDEAAQENDVYQEQLLELEDLDEFAALLDDLTQALEAQDEAEPDLSSYDVRRLVVS